MLRLNLNWVFYRFFAIFFMFPLPSCGSSKSSDISNIQQYELPDNIKVEIDSLRIGPKIFPKIPVGKPLLDWTKSLMDTVYLAVNDLPVELRNSKFYNVLVFNLSNEHHKVFDDLVFSATLEHQGQKFAVWVFSSGEFTNFGQGGYKNWAMKGWYTRDIVDESYVIQFTQPKS